MTAALFEEPGEQQPSKRTKAVKRAKPDPRDFRRIRVGDLVIDERKQREIDPEKVAKIANEWNWARFEALTVCARTDAGFDVVEGQHRASAARVCGDLDLLVPCMILEATTTDKQQSQIALDIVQGRRGHSAFEQWRLRYNAGQPHEIYATAILEKHAMRVGKSTSAMTIGAVQTVKRIVHGGHFSPEYGADILDRVLGIIGAAFPTHDHESNVSRWDRYLLLAVSQAVVRWPDLDDRRLSMSLRVRPAGQWTAMTRGVKPAPEAAILSSLTSEYNRNRRKGRLS
jgi:hypothetical protein